MHDEVFDAAQESASLYKDNTAASSPSEAYANLSLESQETAGSMAASASQDPREQRSPEQTKEHTLRPLPRSSSPAKRPASDMDDVGKEDMEIDTPTRASRRGSAQGSPSTAKPTSGIPRSKSVDMMDATSSATPGASGSNSDTGSFTPAESAATSVSTTGCAQPSPAPTSAVAPPLSLDEQMGQIMVIHARHQLAEGQETFLISEKWLQRVFSRTTEYANKADQFDKSAAEGEIGPIDNSDLVDQTLLAEELFDPSGDLFIPLKPELQLAHDFEALPVEAWNLVVSWYGVKPGTPVIRRYVHNTAPPDAEENLQYELYPPIFTIRKLYNDSAGMSTEMLHDSQKNSPRIVMSRSENYQQFLRAAKTAAGIDMKTKVQVWRVLVTATTEEPTQPAGILTPESSPRHGSPQPGKQSTPKLVMDVASFTSLSEGSERELLDFKDETANDKYNGHLNLQTVGLAENQVLVLEEQDPKGEFVSERSKKSAAKHGVQLGKNGSKAQAQGLNGNSNNGRNSSSQSGPVTRGRTRRDGRTRGTVGLTNLGNTCYMNSALQCLRSVEELTLYFLQEKYKKEINANNPLGHKGAMAKSYAGLLASIYDESSPSAFAPRNFKFALGKAQPLFSGYGQQDSQEFLSFLVDALHEDLNRIHNKPYMEYPESDDNTVNDPEAIKALGEKYRAIHHARNDSVATDLFNGFYKNTMVCPECEKVSITFDPFSAVTLQLPIEHTWQHTISFVPLQGPIVAVHVDIDKMGTIRSLKEYVAKRFPGVEWNRLMAAEVHCHKFYRWFEDTKTIAEYTIGARDDIFLFELDHVPTNFPAPKKKRNNSNRSMVSFHNASSDEDIPSSDSPLAERMLVPVFHRAPNTATYKGSSRMLALLPFCVVLTREEAKNEDAILKKVLGRVAKLTTRPFLTEDDDSASYNESRAVSDAVLTTDEDADVDPRVQDHSVEGEDNLVEVTMTEAPETLDLPDSGSPDQEQLDVLSSRLKVRKMCEQLFEMKHTRPGREIVTTGWSTVDQNKTLPSIRSRVPPPPPSSTPSDDAASSKSSNEDAEDIPEFSSTGQESMEMGPSSEDDPPAISRGGRKNDRKNKGHKNSKHMKSYTKKGKHRVADQPDRYSETESGDDAMLIRPGEGIVLEWTAEGYDALFEGGDVNDSRGMETWKHLEPIEDEELREKKARRAARKKSGITLDECFAETSKSEVLSEENAWYCGRCKELRRATKTLEIWTAPDILVVHLKRFSAQRTFRDKLEVLVDFPVEGLDLSGRVGLPEGKDLVYDLFAVDNHYGGLGGGHYTAYAQNFFDKNWYEYNDSSVSMRQNPRSVVTPAAYLLFYRRRSSTPLGPPYLQDIVNAAWNTNSDELGDAEDSELNSRNPSRSPAGNGSRLGDSSRNGSSSAGTGAAVAPLRGGGSTSGITAGTLARSGVGAATLDDDDTTDVDQDPPPYDEGYADDEDANYDLSNIGDIYAPLHAQADPVWDFSNIRKESVTDDVFDDTVSNAPELGSNGPDDLQSRMLEDFGDDLGTRPGMTTPEEDEDMPILVGDDAATVPIPGDYEDDGPVAELVLDDHEGDHVKMD